MKKIKCSKKMIVYIVFFVIFITIALYFRFKISHIYMDAIRLYNEKKYDSAKKTIETSSISMGFTENPEKVSDFQKISCIKKEFDLNQYKTFPNLFPFTLKLQININFHPFNLNNSTMYDNVC